jgi:hypothetical protein
MEEWASLEVMSKATFDQLDLALASLYFSQRARSRLYSLRASYQVGRDFLGAQDFRRLRFIRWLYRTGRLTP